MNISEYIIWYWGDAYFKIWLNLDDNMWFMFWLSFLGINIKNNWCNMLQERQLLQRHCTWLSFLFYCHISQAAGCRMYDSCNIMTLYSLGNVWIMWTVWVNWNIKVRLEGQRVNNQIFLNFQKLFFNL